MADEPQGAVPPPPPGFERVAQAPGDARPPPPGYERPAAPSVWESLGRGAVEGATFGFDDRLGMDRDAREASRRANPWAHFFGEMAGGLLPMAGAALLPTGATQAAAAGRAAQLASRGAGLVRAALVPGDISTAARAVGQGAKLGTTYGALSGAGHTDTSQSTGTLDAARDMASNALTSGIVGGVFGAPLGLVGHGIYRGAQALGGLRANAAAETSAMPGVTVPGQQPVSSGALTTALRNLEADRITPQQVIDDILAEFPSATASAQGGMARRFWGPTNNRQPWTQEQVLEVVSRRAQGQTANEISHIMRSGNQGVGPGEKAISTLLDELESRHLGPLNLIDRAGMVRPGSGDNTQWTMRAAAATPGEHVGIAKETLLGRQMEAQGRLSDAIGRIVGDNDFARVAAVHDARLQSAAQRAYAEAIANEGAFDLMPIFTKWEAKFDQMRGVVPDGVRQRLNAMMWQGTDAAGNPVKLPPQNLEGFIYARQGLRDLIGDLPQGNNLRRHLTQLYDEMSDEVARNNPLWVQANQLYRDGMAGREALEAGAAMTTRLNSRSRDNLSFFTTAENAHKTASKELAEAQKVLRRHDRQGTAPTADELARAEAAQGRVDAYAQHMELFRVGLARALNDMLLNQGETHNLTKQLLLPGTREMITRVLGREQAEQFYKVMRAEAAMHRTYSSQFGSQTTPLREKIDEMNWAPQFEVSMANPLTWVQPTLRLAQEAAARTVNARRNKDLMRLYMEEDPLRQLQYLRGMQGLMTARNAAGNAAGRPVTGLAGGLADALADDRVHQTQALPRRTTNRP